MPNLCIFGDCFLVKIPDSQSLIPSKGSHITYSKFLSTAFLILKEGQTKVQVIVRHEHRKALKEWVLQNHILTDESVLDC